MITQEDIDAMWDGIGLVERLRKPIWVKHPLCQPVIDVDSLRTDAYEAADRIEQLERELATEKALADRLADILEWDRKAGRMEAIVTYRKARGL